MNEITKRHHGILRELLESCLVDHPKELVLDVNETKHGAVFWTLEVHADDYRTVCGAKGANIKALTFVAEELGLTVGARYRFWLKESVRGDVRPKRVVEAAEGFDATPAANLLEDLVEACLGNGETVAVEISRDGSRLETPPFAEVVTLTIHPMTEEARTKIVEPFEDDREKRTLLESLRALWKALGARNGVAFTVEVR